ncbi:hypothetical protein KP509_27G007000 [Ceratopteris richardii]|uniref:Protein kinase domain-containing protein n=1 Tax=Ceratopteris richardii TaxID=49495 RepID=A0A8T2RG82_CERRI|nr:hypothetical protein KP509_27G007000 [Ceratopteris richardii]
MSGLAMNSASALEFFFVCSWILVTIRGQTPPEPEIDGLKNFMDMVGRNSNITPPWSDRTKACSWDGVICSNNTVQKLRLSNFKLQGEIPTGTLSKLTNLLDLDLGGNDLSGELEELSHCKALKSINLRDNKYSGDLSSDLFANWSKLTVFDASSNKFTGKFPQSLLKCNHLQTLDLSDNHLSGQVDNISTSFPKLKSIRLHNNEFSGPLPSNFTLWTSLKVFDVSSNGFIGPISESLLQLNSLETLDLSDNHLNGSIPETNFAALITINLSHNSFSGPLPSNFMPSSNLTLFDASSNSFSGPIPESLLHLKRLETLDLSDNQLTGSIPELPTWSLTNFNVSNNNLSSAFPAGYGRFDSSSFLNTSLCGVPLSPCPLSGKKDRRISGGSIAAIILGIVLGILVFLLFRWFLRSSNTRTKFFRKASNLRLYGPVQCRDFREHNVYRGRWLNFFKPNWKFDLDVLSEGSAVALPKGTLGNSFKVDLKSGESYVVKQLANVSIGEGAFDEKMRKLGSQQHENLMPITAYFCGREEKLLITEHMDNGSLLSRLRDNAAGKKSLTWDTRVRIAIGAAKGIKYLHDHKLAHGHIKASNVLLTSNDDTRLSDYGLAEIVPELEPPGSSDPQMASRENLCLRKDIRDFGWLLSELFETLNSVQPFVERTVEGTHEDVERLRRLAKNCSDDSSKSGPTIEEVLTELRSLGMGNRGKQHCFPTIHGSFNSLLMSKVKV